MPEIEQPSAGGPPTKPDRRSQPSAADMDRHLELYRTAYEEGKRALDDQQDELNGMRTRGVQFTAFVGAATAFLAGTGLKAIHRDATFYVLAIAASALSVLLILLLLVLLRPSKERKWQYRLSTEVLIGGWIEREVPLPNEASFLRALAQRYDKMRTDNESLLGWLRKWYQLLIVVGTAQVAVWAALVWVKG